MCVQILFFAVLLCIVVNRSFYLGSEILNFSHCIFFFFFKFIYLESVCECEQGWEGREGGGGQREMERENPKQAPRPTWGLKPTNCEIMT